MKKKLPEINYEEVMWSLASVSKVEIHGTDPGQHTIVKFHVDLFGFSSTGTYYPDEDKFILDLGMPSSRMKPIIKDKILQQIGHEYGRD